MLPLSLMNGVALGLTQERKREKKKKATKWPHRSADLNIFTSSMGPNVGQPWPRLVSSPVWERSPASVDVATLSCVLEKGREGKEPSLRALARSKQPLVVYQHNAFNGFNCHAQFRAACVCRRSHWLLLPPAALVPNHDSALFKVRPASPAVLHEFWMRMWLASWNCSWSGLDSSV